MQERDLYQATLHTLQLAEEFGGTLHTSRSHQDLLVPGARHFHDPPGGIEILGGYTETQTPLDSGICLKFEYEPSCELRRIPEEVSESLGT